jgi:hypothetical protein
MPDKLPPTGGDSNDNSGPETGRNCQDADWEAERRGELVQRAWKQRELAESDEPSTDRIAARARSRRLALSQSLPFWPRYESVEFVFTDPLPDYVDPHRFCAPYEPGRDLATWLASLVPPHSDVVRMASLQPEGNDWNSFGCAPLIAERAFPPPPRQRRLLNRELSARMPPVIAREPNRQAPRKGKPMREMNIAFALDIFGMETIDAAQALDLEDCFIYPSDTKKGKFLINGKEWDKKLSSESRGGYRYLAPGRDRLSRLGAWPWCLTHDGRLPPRWYCQEKYATELATWHYQQTLTTLASAAATFDTAAARELARDTYRQWYTTPGSSQGHTPRKS